MVSLALSLALSPAMASDQQSELAVNIPVAIKGESCVAPLDEMRRNHMTLLFHQRDRTVYQGERDTRFALTGCLECHTQKDGFGEFIPINAEGQFCYSCHAYTAVKMDCFECHATTPGHQAASNN